MAKKPELDEEVKRCRRVREEIGKRFKSLDAYCDYLEQKDRVHQGCRSGAFVRKMKKVAKSFRISTGRREANRTPCRRGKSPVPR